MVENYCDIQTTNAHVDAHAWRASSKYVGECECDERIENDSDWEDGDQQDDDQRNVFDLFDNEEDL